MARQHARPNEIDPPDCRSGRHEQGNALPVAPGLHICVACREVVEDALINLPSLFDLSAYVLDRRPNGSIAFEAVVSVRSEILGVLATWCAFVTGERGVSEPEELGIRPLVAFLAVHLHWLCQHPAAPALVGDLTGLTTAVRAAARPETGAGREPRRETAE